MDSSYYRPPDIFRQPAIFIKKRDVHHCNDYENMRSWKTDASKMNSVLLRKVSGDLNDCITSKKLKTDCWNIASKDSVTSFSVNEGTILLGTGGSSNNLQLYQLKENESHQKKRKLHSLQTISVPGDSILSTDILELGCNEAISAHDAHAHDRVLLTGHADGIVNLISTSTVKGNARILKRFNHSKYLKVTAQNDAFDFDTQLYNSRRSKPIRHLKFWNKHHFISMINESLFIYDVNQQSKSPLYLHSFAGLESFDVNPANPYSLALAGSSFGNAGVALLDLRSGDNTQLLVPESPKIGNGKSSATKWLDEYTLSNSVGSDLKLWDIRYGGLTAEFSGHKGHINSLHWDDDLKRLYSSDDQGLILSWNVKDLNFGEEVLHCSPSHGLQSFNTGNDVVQCGNIIKSPDLERLTDITYLGTEFIGLSNSNLITLQDQELRCHSVIDVPIVLPPPRNPLRLSKPAADSQTTLTYSSSDEVHDEIISTFEDSEDTLEYELSAPMTTGYPTMFDMKDDPTQPVPFLSGIRRDSDATFV